MAGHGIVEKIAYGGGNDDQCIQSLPGATQLLHYSQDGGGPYIEATIFNEYDAFIILWVQLQGIQVAFSCG